MSPVVSHGISREAVPTGPPWVTSSSVQPLATAVSLRLFANKSSDSQCPAQAAALAGSPGQRSQPHWPPSTALEIAGDHTPSQGSSSTPSADLEDPLHHRLQAGWIKAGNTLWPAWMDVLGLLGLPKPLTCPMPTNSPGKESFRPSRSLALWIFSKHMACSFLKMQSECMAVACRKYAGWVMGGDRALPPTQALEAASQE